MAHTARSALICRRCLFALYKGSLRSGSVKSLWRSFHASTRVNTVKPFLLTDIGEGTRECQIIQWYVQPGARVEQFDKLCEVQSDKAATDITSPFDGIVKKLHYEQDDTAIVGKPLVDIDVIGEDNLEMDKSMSGGKALPPAIEVDPSADQAAEVSPGDREERVGSMEERSLRSGSAHKSLATPAVRHLSKELKINIEDVAGTGRDGRVTKEDLHKHIGSKSQSISTQADPSGARQVDKIVPLTPIQTAMFKTMTNSLSIPHFLYTTTADTTNLSALRQRMNAKRDKLDRLSALPFVLKAISQALQHHPLLNAALDTTTDPAKPQLIHRASHDFGVAIDTPQGLLVPVVRNVASLSVAELAARIRDLSARAAAGRLEAAELKGASFTVSNVGSIGGGVVSPVIVQPQLAIVGVGRAKVLPAFDAKGDLVKREEVVFSWSADHRVVDGAECARAAEKVKGYLEGVDEWILDLR